MWKIIQCGKVSPLYFNYVKWSFVSNFFISAESVLSTHSMLSALSVENSSFNMSFNYIGKDIIGQFGGMLYINKMANKADKDPQKFIKYSMSIQQASTIIECMTPLLPVNMFLFLGSSANIGKNISFAGFGAINAKIIPKLALDNNIGEMYAKLAVVNTFGSTLGMSFGLFIALKFPDPYLRVFFASLFGFLRYKSYNLAIKDIL